MMRKAVILATVASGIAFAAAPASAETLDVAGTVAPYCNVSLSGVSSGTATVAMLAEQKIANLTIKCNAASGTKLVVNPTNGDLLSSAGNRINYTFRLVSEKPEYNIKETDTTIGDAEGFGKFTTGNPGFSRELAAGTPLDFFMNVNVRNEPQPDFAVVNQFPAAAAPAGTYSETFSFTLSQV